MIYHIAKDNTISYNIGERNIMALTEKNCLTCNNKFMTKRANHTGRNPTFCSKSCWRPVFMIKDDPRLKWRLGKGFWQISTDEEKWQRVIEKFEKLVIKNAEGCWGWKNILMTNGYGLIGMGKRKGMTAHRVSWIIHNGPILNQLHVLHKCDNRSCSRPDHLFLGTLNDNMADMVSKNRQMKGVNHYCAKLDVSQVRKIKELIKSGKSIFSISKMFNVNSGTIQNISVGRTWKDV